MRAMTAIVAAIAFCAEVAALADYTVRDEGMWPKTWPAGLEPFRKQSRTLRGSLMELTTYEMPFTTREEFELAWPHLLKVKGESAPIVLLRGPDMNLGTALKAGVRIRCALGHPDREVAPDGPDPRSNAIERTLASVDLHRGGR